MEFKSLFWWVVIIKNLINFCANLQWVCFEVNIILSVYHDIVYVFFYSYSWDRLIRFLIHYRVHIAKRLGEGSLDTGFFLHRFCSWFGHFFEIALSWDNFFILFENNWRMSRVWQLVSIIIVSHWNIRLFTIIIIFFMNFPNVNGLLLWSSICPV